MFRYVQFVAHMDFVKTQRASLSQYQQNKATQNKNMRMLNLVVVGYHGLIPFLIFICLIFAQEIIPAQVLSPYFIFNRIKNDMFTLFLELSV